MANLDRIVNVAISLNTTAIKEQNFSDVLVLGAHVLAVNRVLVVTEAAELLGLGINQNDPLYIAVRDAFKQIPTVQRVFVGRRQVETSRVTVTRASVTVYKITMQWRAADGSVQSADATFTGLADSTPTTIAAGLIAAITASAAPVTATAVGAEISITADDEGTAVAVSVKGNLSVAIPTSAETPTAALTACRQENADWYGVALASRDEADILDAAEWVESNGCLFGVSSSQAGIIDAAIDTDLASKCQQKQYFRTHVWYHGKAASEALEAAVMANRFTFYPGGETWANVRLAGVTYDNLAEGKALAAHAKNANTFEQMRNFAITQKGKVAAGEWIDVIRGRDWLAEQVKIEVATQLINANGKVPFTDGGIQILANGLRKALLLGQSRGLIAPDEIDGAGNKIPGFVLSIPRSMDVSTNDKANRILRDLKFSARLAGAIHVAEIKGNLTYQQI
ncbi:hypothetical protein AVE30378_02558 [Achromobacter veterisilvae]|uniref:DUF3383 domain-containing protein n=1 Tax=Achromobacter veterisilvae TaxID=2069367 RepID=A0A446CHH1_9BURK|nr:DUF3383 family protein [Achromobacter veterisilvae]SSW67312.1 hypothetical protein AVE30378_02558 [Achromobacter veterisilvae]